jgi:hypothetical protein
MGDGSVAQASKRQQLPRQAVGLHSHLEWQRPQVTETGAAATPRLSDREASKKLFARNSSDVLS